LLRETTARTDFSRRLIDYPKVGVGRRRKERQCQCRDPENRIPATSPPTRCCTLLAHATPSRPDLGSANMAQGLDLELELDGPVSKFQILGF
jgi:hypothetical protein